MQALSLVLALCLCPASAALAAGPSDAYEATISSLHGDVTVETASKPGPRKPARVGQALRAEDTLRTGPDGRVEVRLADDGLFELQSNAVLVFSTLDRPDTSLTLRLGALFSKLRSLGSGRRLRVRSKLAVAAVRGTEFAVEAREDGAVFAVFDEGSVAVETEGRAPVLLEPDRETEVLPGEAPAAPHELRHFAFARQRMNILRGRMRYFDGKWRGKYRAPKKGSDPTREE